MITVGPSTETLGVFMQMLTFLDGHTQVPAQGPLHTNFTNNYRALAAMIARRQSIYVTPLGDDGGA